MGIRFRESSNEETATISQFLGEALLFTTMCIIGLPVEVHIKDGSIYSGVFHTANCVENDYGIILKKARMVKKGTHAANVANGGVVETLVVLPGDLVQIVAKAVMLPTNDLFGDVACDDVGAFAGIISSFQNSENEPIFVDSSVDKEQVLQRRQIGVGMPQPEGNGCHKSDSVKEEHVHAMQYSSSSTSLDDCFSQPITVEENHTAMMSKQLPNGRCADYGISSDTKSNGNSHNSPTATDILCTDGSNSGVPHLENSGVDSDKNCSSTNSTEVVLPQHSVSKRSAKESKLNPAAKIFSPSSVNIGPAARPVMPAVASMAYVPNNFPGVPITASQPEVGIRHVAARSAWPVKFVPHASLPAANGGSGLQYSQPVQIAGHMMNRAQPIRYSSHYQPIQAGPPYVLSNSQNGMVGRLGQLVYPVTHDMVQGAAALSLTSHLLLTPHQMHFQKHEGQPPPLSLTPPLLASRQQPYPVPSHIQQPQPPFPAIRPIAVLGSNGPYSAKFP
ncbi:hypothetical protein Ancab_025147 [Ancistrocladus abbreviatus]